MLRWELILMARGWWREINGRAEYARCDAYAYATSMTALYVCVVACVEREVACPLCFWFGFTALETPRTI
jgi:hypothetical protein